MFAVGATVALTQAIPRRWQTVPAGTRARVVIADAGDRDCTIVTASGLCLRVRQDWLEPAPPARSPYARSRREAAHVAPQGR